MLPERPRLTQAAAAGAGGETGVLSLRRLLSIPRMPVGTEVRSCCQVMAPAAMLVVKKTPPEVTTALLFGA